MNKPRTTVEFLDAIKAKHHLPSDYALAKILDVHRQVISRYRHGGTFDEEMAIKVGNLLDIPGGYVNACVMAERTKRPEVREMWQQVARVIYSIAAVGIIGAGTLLTPSPSPASSGQEYTLHALRRKNRPWPLQMARNRRSRPRGTIPHQIPLKIAPRLAAH
mgnify:CR=1 FL=1